MSKPPRCRPPRQRHLGVMAPRGNMPSKPLVRLNDGDNMEPQTAKGRILQLVQSLPDNASIEDAMDRLYLLYKVDKGIEQADSGQKVSHEEARQRLKRWLE